MSEIKLLPCPFCGSETAPRLDWDRMGVEDAWYVVCGTDGCGARSRVFGANESDYCIKAKAAWNRRAESATAHYNPIEQVYFRAGLIACREYMARFVESGNPIIAASIRANWWPRLGDDLGPPRKIDFGELTEGEYGTEGFRCREAGEVSATLEALPVAVAFLENE